MPKNIVIFSDGTGQAGGLRPDQNLSNIYKLYRAARVGPDSPIDPAQQVAFYDAGIGTENDEGRIPLRAVQWFRRLWSAVTGAGLSRNIADCYEAIIKHYEPGDRIFLFGFSRGAFTARCVGGVMSLCGVPRHAAGGGPLPRYGRGLRDIAVEAVGRVYEHGNGRDDPKGVFKKERLEQARRFREKYGAEEYRSDDGTTVQGKVVPHFIGVFDTVAAVGAKGWRRVGFLLLLEVFLAAMCAAPAAVVALFRPAWFLMCFLVLNGIAILLIGAAEFRNRLKWITNFEGRKIKRHLAGWNYKFHDRALNTRVRQARHALAIDENRKDFDRVPWGETTKAPDRPGEPEWLRQCWFAGVHSDIGGSYTEDESRLSDIALDWMLAQATELPAPLLVDRSKLQLFPHPAGMQHSEAEQASEGRLAWLFKWTEQDRDIAPDAPLDPTVLARFALDEVSHYGRQRKYRPASLAGHEQVRHLYQEQPAGPRAAALPDVAPAVSPPA